MYRTPKIWILVVVLFAVTAGFFGSSLAYGAEKNWTGFYGDDRDKQLNGMGNVIVDLNPQIEDMIYKGWKHESPETLFMVSQILFTRERLAGKTGGKFQAADILERASELAVKQKNVAVLNLAADLWADAKLGPGNAEKAKKYGDTAKLSAKKEERGLYDYYVAYSKRGGLIYWQVFQQVSSSDRRFKAAIYEKGYDYFYGPFDTADRASAWAYLNFY